MNAAMRPRLVLSAQDGDGSQIPYLIFVSDFLIAATLLGFIGFLPAGALAYGVYEDGIIDLLKTNYGITLPPSTDAPQLFSQAYFTPRPFAEEFDNGLQAIEGYLDPDNGDFADMYCLFIGAATTPVALPGKPMLRYTPQEFSATTVAPKGTIKVNGQDVPRPQIPDPQLFLFDRLGHPVTGNDDIDDTNQQSLIPLGTITQPGVYILAVTGSGYDPADASLSALFTNNSTGLKTPANAAGVQAGWTGTHNQDGYYRVEFGMQDPQNAENSRFGAEHWVTPEPSSFVLGLLALGSMLLWKVLG